MGAASRGLHIARLVLLSGVLMVLWMLMTAQESSASTDGARAAKAGAGPKVDAMLTDMSQRVAPAVTPTVSRVTQAAVKPAIQPSAPAEEDSSAAPGEPVQSPKASSDNKIGVARTVRTEVVPAVREVAQTAVATVDGVRSRALEEAAATGGALGLEPVTKPLVQVAHSVAGLLVADTAEAAGSVPDLADALPVPVPALPPAAEESVTAPGDELLAAVSASDLRPARGSAPAPGLVAGEQIPGADSSGAALGWAQGSARPSHVWASASASARSGNGAPSPSAPLAPASSGTALAASSSQGSQGHDVAADGTDTLLVPSAVRASMTSGQFHGWSGPQLLPGFSPE
jgi:hypothetical protein